MGKMSQSQREDTVRFHLHGLLRAVSHSFPAPLAGSPTPFPRGAGRSRLARGWGAKTWGARRAVPWPCSEAPCPLTPQRQGVPTVTDITVTPQETLLRAWLLGQ